MDLWNGSQVNTVQISSTGNSYFTGGNLGVGITGPTAPLHVRAGQAIARLETTGAANGSVLELQNDFASPFFLGAINFLDNVGHVPLQIGGFENGDMAFRAGGTERVRITSIGVLQMPRSSDGLVTVSLNADDGTGSGLITTSVLQITGGADLSEQFDVGEAADSQLASSGSIQPGMVVCIDPENPGRLVLSTKPYDRTVAGIVSGSGGIRPGMLMGHQGTLADGKHPVALTGRVYCLADASNLSIEPGDLLTTSDTPGHAMKVNNPTYAQGAILGKAMSKLEKGKGLVLVLVTLQ
jgi:hypothetical protein